MANVVSCLYEFGPFVLDPAERLLTSHGRPVPLSPKAFDVLLVLVQHSGHLVDKQALIEMVWPGLFVEEGNLCVMVSMIRKALGSEEEKYKYIETVPKRGYRFVAGVRRIESDSSADLHFSESVRAITRQGPQTVLTPQSQAFPEFQPVRTTFDTSHPFEQPYIPALPQIRTRRGWLAALVPLVVIMGISIWLLDKRLSTHLTSGTSSIRSLAVLPFVTVGETSQDAYLGMGMSDAVITKLGNTGKIVVRPTSAMARYAGSSRDPQAAGKEQGVDAVVDGRIQRADDRLRLTVQLIRTSDGSQIWGETFDEKYTNLFGVEDAISEQVVRSIQLTLTGEERKRMAQRSTQNSDAYQAYVKGRFFCNKRTTEGVQTGLRYFQQAVALDPGYSRAYAGVAESYALLGLFTVLPPKVAFPKAKEAATKALENDPELAEAHAALGFVSFYFDWEGLAAENEFRHALRSDPNYGIAHYWYAEDLIAMGRFSEATAEAKLGVQSDPLSLTGNTVAGMVPFFAGDSDRAIESFHKTIEIDSNFPRVHFRMGNVFLLKGMYAEAVGEFQKAMQLSGGRDQDDAYYQAALGETYALMGNDNEARKVLAHLTKLSNNHYVPAYAIALIYVGLGEKDRAFEWLEKATVDRSTSMAYLKVDPLLNNLRSDQRFASLLQQIHF